MAIRGRKRLEVKKNENEKSINEKSWAEALRQGALNEIDSKGKYDGSFKVLSEDVVEEWLKTLPAGISGNLTKNDNSR
mgnify:CR=1 FL=1